MKVLFWCVLLLTLGGRSGFAQIDTTDMRAIIERLEYLNDQVDVDFYPEPDYFKKFSFDYKRDTIFIHLHLWHLNSLSPLPETDTIREWRKIFLPVGAIGSIRGGSGISITSREKKGFGYSVWGEESQEIAPDTFRFSNYTQLSLVDVRSRNGISLARYLDSLSILFQDIVELSKAAATDYGTAHSIDCTTLDSIEVLLPSASNTDQPFIAISNNWYWGKNNEELSEKAKVNGETDLDLIVESELIKKIGQEQFHSPQYEDLEVFFVLTPENEIKNLYLTNEIFWYLKHGETSTQAAQLDVNNDEMIQRAKTMFGFMTLDEIELIKQVVRSLKWESGQCNGERINTLVTLNFNTIP